jgi:glycosyltransferase involved in cell wall biosynthesis
MKIVHIITRMILGGAQENTLLTCEGLHARGHEVTLVTGPPRGPEGQLLDRARAGGYRVIVLDLLRREIHPFRDAVCGRQVGRLLAESAADVVHTHSSKAGILGRQAAWRARRAGRLPAGSRIVHTIHGLPFHRYAGRMANRLYIRLERRAARQADAIVSVADAMTRQALAVGVGRPEQFVTIRSGLEIDRFRHRPEGAGAFRASLGLGDEDVLVTQVSRLAELKGHEFLLAAAASIADPRVHLCFVGDGRLRGRIERAIASAGLGGRVHLTGLLPPERVPAVMHATDVLAHCSLREGLARTLPQAMLAGKPVVSFDVDGAAEVVDERTGVLLSAGDVPGLVQSVTRLAADADLRRGLGAAGRERAEAMFDHNEMVDEIEHLYRGLTASR